MKNYDGGFATFLETLDKGTPRDQLIKQLSDIFDDVATAADKVTDLEARVALKVAAAVGKEKIQQIKKV